jgi:hypothetical protein
MSGTPWNSISNKTWRRFLLRGQIGLRKILKSCCTVEERRIAKKLQSSREGHRT